MCEISTVVCVELVMIVPQCNQVVFGKVVYLPLLVDAAGIY